MIPASTLEVMMLALMASAHEPHIKVLGAIVWVVYFRYSASRALLESIAKWLHDRNNPPGGTA